ncbi:hypothetical protein V2J09_004295 [Rumex salicifolius]
MSIEVDEEEDVEKPHVSIIEAAQKASLLEESIKPSILEPKINYSESDQQDSNLDEKAEVWLAVAGPFPTVIAVFTLDHFRTRGLPDASPEFPVGSPAIEIIDLLRPLAALYFRGKVPDQLQLEREQIMSNLKKVMTKLYKFVYRIASKKVESTLSRPKECVLKPHSISLDEDLDDAARQVQDQVRDRAEAGFSEEKDEDDEPPKEEASRAQVGGKRLNPEKLGCYAIVDGEVDFDSALKKADGSIPSSGLISLKSNGSSSSREKKRKEAGDKKRSKRGDSHRKSSKRTKAIYTMVIKVATSSKSAYAS